MNQIFKDEVLTRSIRDDEVKATPRSDVTARTIIVSNRVPSPSEKGATAGGLAVALADAVTPGTIWFGWSGKRADTTSKTANLNVNEGRHLRHHRYR